MGEYEIIQSENHMAKFKNAKLLIFENILNEIKKRKQKNRAFVLGINGIDGSGKTEFAKNFKKFLLSQKINAQIIHIDDFCNSKSIRHSGNDQVYNCFYKTFKIDYIVKNLLIPIQENSDFTTDLTLLDLDTDKYEIKKKYTCDKRTIIIFEGVYLFRKEFISYIDYKIFLDISLNECIKRVKSRDGKDIIKKLNKKYLPAQCKYMKEFLPLEIADMIVNNFDWDSPKIKINSDYK